MAYYRSEKFSGWAFILSCAYRNKKSPAPSCRFAASNADQRRIWQDRSSFTPNRYRRAQADSRVPQFKGGNRMESSATRQQPETGGRMATAEQAYLRTELEQRRERLHEALHSPAADASLSQLLAAVDTALSRINQGTFGLCETCHET